MVVRVSRDLDDLLSFGLGAGPESGVEVGSRQTELGNFWSWLGFLGSTSGVEPASTVQPLLKLFGKSHLDKIKVRGMEKLSQSYSEPLLASFGESLMSMTDEDADVTAERQRILNGLRDNAINICLQNLGKVYLTRKNHAMKITVHSLTFAVQEGKFTRLWSVRRSKEGCKVTVGGLGWPRCRWGRVCLALGLQNRGPATAGSCRAESVAIPGRSASFIIATSYPEFLATRIYRNCSMEDLTLAKMMVRPTSFFQEDLSNRAAFSEEMYGSVDNVFMLCGEDASLTPDY
ncbi:Polyneuridine-aldehyde esterase [Platanthera zijinensis]|uniref:Polyneuridine-aldehyde esterase n=1 Tax=Platanthera zijinensis TaxID=2320716 RepID=A0AAP0AU31_9ASPA